MIFNNNSENLDELTHVKHPFEPVFNTNSLILILGSFPSVKSRQENFYYAHNRNRFWKIISYITDTKIVPITIDDRKDMLIKNKIALWDVIDSCDIYKSRDNSIKNVKPVSLLDIIEKTNIYQIFANGSKAYNLYMKYCFNELNMKIIKLPSTSAANASYNFERLLSEWKQIKNFLINVT